MYIYYDYFLLSVRYVSPYVVRTRMYLFLNITDWRLESIHGQYG